MKKLLIASLLAASLLPTGAIAGKSVLAQFNFARGSITFYVDGTYERRKGSQRAEGNWKYIDGTKIPCPTDFEEDYCRRYYK